MMENLHDLLIQLSDYFGNKSDINNEGGPNTEMSFQRSIDSIIEKLYVPSPAEGVDEVGKVKPVLPKMKTENYRPIFYNTVEEMNKPLSELMEELRSDISKTRGKLHDIKYAYGWEDRIDFIEGGLTCMLVAMYGTQEEWRKFEERKSGLTPTNK